MSSESIASLDSAFEARLTFINTGTQLANAEVRLYDGPKAETPELPPTDSTLLVTIKLQNPPGVVVDGVASLYALEPGLIMNTGNPVWGRIVNRDSETAHDLDVGAVGSGADCELAALTLYAGGLVSFVAATISL